MNKKLIIFFILISLLIAGGVFWWWQSQPKEPKTYKEVFEEPIDPNLEPEKHKEIYEKIQKIVHFPVMYPKEMPEGYKLVEAKVEAGNSNFIYIAKENKKIQIFEGIGDIGKVEGIGLVKLKEGEGWLWKNEDEIGLTLLFEEETQQTYIIIGKDNVTKNELIEVASSFIEI